jgi:hydroxymethylpyrimidine/phosphomethylpyrimidine kinase
VSSNATPIDGSETRFRSAQPAEAAPAAAIALTIAGSDSGGGAGIQADLKTFSALHVYGASVITALTAQNTLGVQGIHDVPADFVAAQMDSVFSDLRIGAVKIGMLSSPDIIDAVASGLERHAARNVILDPVMVATSGDRLIPQDAADRLRERLLPMALVLTPNLPEAAALLGEEVARTEDQMRSQGERLMALGAQSVLMKGGHLDGPQSVDIFVYPGGSGRLEAPRVPTRNTHGTGCTLSSAIAAMLASGSNLVEAVVQAKDYLTDALFAADKLRIGSGSGPVHHFHATWDKAKEPQSQSIP